MQSYEQAEFHRAVSSMLTFFGMILGMGGYWILRAAGIHMFAIMGLLAVLGVSVGLGWLGGRILSHRLDGDGPAAQVIAWAQLVTWLLPPAGMFLSALSWELSRAAYNRRALLMVLSTVGGLGSLANAVTGLVLDPAAYALS
jgi:hypothetical protein